MNFLILYIFTCTYSHIDPNRLRSHALTLQGRADLNTFRRRRSQLSGSRTLITASAAIQTLPGPCYSCETRDLRSKPSTNSPEIIRNPLYPKLRLVKRASKAPKSVMINFCRSSTKPLADGPHSGTGNDSRQNPITLPVAACCLKALNRAFRPRNRLKTSLNPRKTRKMASKGLRLT